jgi:hypothetical protein
VCKDCLQKSGKSAFEFQDDVSPDLTHEAYCIACYDRVVAPALEVYSEILARAKHVYVFTKKHKRIPLIRKSNHQVKHNDCPDRQEATLHLAFQAAQQGFNALVNTEMVSTKIRNAGHQKLHWSGTAYPAQINPARLEDEYPI